jgi:alpha-L-fucosidase
MAVRESAFIRVPNFGREVLMDRRTFIHSAAAIAAGGWVSPRLRASVVAPTPSAAQLKWQRDELAMFLHFGVNTFTGREWGDGTEDPAIFNPTNLDARQWARAARAGGFRAMILTAKHHDGFCLWPTATTQHSVASSPFRNGTGDVVREFVDACRAEGLRPGLYLSPWDRNHPTYGDSPRYNDVYAAQLTELLTRYGELAEVWFDGANGEGPNGKRQVYDWPRVFGLVRRFQPNVVMFSDAGPDVRWCGNEKGLAGDPNWSMMDPGAVAYPGDPRPEVTDALQHGDPAGSVWRPAEADVSIRPGWFYHAEEDDKVRDVANLVELYFSSVGRNAKLLLNVPPTREGLLHATDVAHLAAFRARLSELFDTDLAKGARHHWRPSGERSAMLEVDLGRDVSVGVLRMEEDIRHGQSVVLYRVLGSRGDDWQLLSRGGTIGYAKLDRVQPTIVRRIRVIVDDALRTPRPLALRAFA